MKNLKVGQILYKLNIGNAARNRKQTLMPVEVIKIGRKYVTVSELDKKDRSYLHDVANIENGREKTEYSANFILYESEQEWEDKKESEVLLRKFRDIFGSYGKNNISLDQLRKINVIIEGEI